MIQRALSFACASARRVAAAYCSSVAPRAGDPAQVECLVGAAEDGVGQADLFRLVLLRRDQRERELERLGRVRRLLELLDDVVRADVLQVRVQLARGVLLLQLGES
jgi:hypothetical protein